MFARQKTRIRGTFASNQVVLQIDNSTKLGIVQGMQLQVSRQFNQIYSLTGAGAGDEFREVDAYRVGGRVQGQGQLNRILGPEAESLRDFYEDMGNECNYKKLEFSLGASACKPGGQTSGATTKYSILDTTMTAASINVNSNDVLINEGVQLIFADLDVV